MALKGIMSHFEPYQLRSGPTLWNGSPLHTEQAYVLASPHNSNLCVLLVPTIP